VIACWLRVVKPDGWRSGLAGGRGAGNGGMPAFLNDPERFPTFVGGGVRCWLLPGAERAFPGAGCCVHYRPGGGRWLA
jgi:hypothetical protein